MPILRRSRRPSALRVVCAVRYGGELPIRIDRRVRGMNASYEARRSLVQDWLVSRRLAIAQRGVAGAYDPHVTLSRLRFGQPHNASIRSFLTLQYGSCPYVGWRQRRTRRSQRRRAGSRYRRPQDCPAPCPTRPSCFRGWPAYSVSTSPSPPPGNALPPRGSGRPWSRRVRRAVSLVLVAATRRSESEPSRKLAPPESP
jgi:hypothetical protein